MKRWKLAMYILAVLATLAIVAAIGFRREYVLPADGLVDVQVSTSDRDVVVSGAIRASGAKITGTTVSRYGDELLVRVFGAAIESGDIPEETPGTFRVVLRPSDDVRVIKVGERARWLTLGRVFSMPVGIPLLKPNETSERVVYTRGAAQ